MNWKSLAFGGLLVGGAVYLLKQFSNKIGYSFQGIKWLGFNGLKMRLALRYTLDNGNDIPATVTSFKGNVKYGDHELSDVNVEQAIVIPPGGTEKMEVTFSVSPGQLLAELLQFFEKKEGFSKFRITGWLSGKVGQVPYKYPVNEKLELAE